MSNSEKPIPNSNTEEQPKESRSKFRIGCLGFLWIGAFVLFFFAWLQLGESVPLEISQDTTFLTEPLKPGTGPPRIDYLRVLEERNYPPQMKTDENGWRFLVRNIEFPELFGQGSDPMDWATQQQYFEKLGLAPFITPPPLRIESPVEALKHIESTQPEQFEKMKTVFLEKLRLRKTETQRQLEELEKTQGSTENPERLKRVRENLEGIDRILQHADPDYFSVESCISYPWTLEDYPLLESWIQRGDAVVAILREAVEKPVFAMPYLGDEQGNIVQPAGWNEYDFIYEIVLFFQARIDFHIGNGRYDAAIEETLIARRLLRLHGNHGAIWSENVFVKRHIPVRREIDLPECPMNTEQLTRLLEGWNRLPESITFEEYLRNDHLCTLDFLQSAMDDRIKLDDYMYGIYERLIFSKLNWNVIFQHINQSFQNRIDGTYVPSPESYNPLPLLFVNSRSKAIAVQIEQFFVNHEESAFVEIREADETFCDRIQELIEEKKRENSPQPQFP